MEKANEIREWMGHRVSAIMGFDADMFDQALALKDSREIVKFFTEFMGDTAEVRRFGEEAANKIRVLAALPVASAAAPAPVRLQSAVGSAQSAPATQPSVTAPTARLVSHSGGAKVASSGRQKGSSRGAPNTLGADDGVFRVAPPAVPQKQGGGSQTKALPSSTAPSLPTTSHAPLEAVQPVPTPSSAPLKATAPSFMPTKAVQPTPEPSPALPYVPPCGCFATLHGLYTNCTGCGRIQCEKEASLVCSECSGSLRVSGMGATLTVDTAAAARSKAAREDAARAEAPLQALIRGPAPAPTAAAAGAGAAPTPSSDSATAQPLYRGADAEARRHRDQLLEFQRTSAVRTRVIDDAGDDFADAASPWLSKAEQAAKAAAAEKRERDARTRTRTVQLTLSFAGGEEAGVGGVSVRETSKDEAAAAAAAAATAAQAALAAGEAASAGWSATAPTPAGWSARAAARPESAEVPVRPPAPKWTSLFGSARLQHDDPLAAVEGT